MSTQTPWMFQDSPAIVAHRGYTGRYPENTLLSLAAAVSYGARFLEFDVQLTRDGVPVLCHDENAAALRRRPAPRARPRLERVTQRDDGRVSAPSRRIFRRAAQHAAGCGRASGAVATHHEFLSKSKSTVRPSLASHTRSNASSRRCVTCPIHT